jgi:hypothetical protein
MGSVMVTVMNVSAAYDIFRITDSSYYYAVSYLILSYDGRIMQ